jgi:hypothetical protein
MVIREFSLAFVCRDGFVAVDFSDLRKRVNAEVDRCPTRHPPQKLGWDQRMQLIDAFLGVGKLITICIESSEKKEEIPNAVETLTVCRH